MPTVAVAARASDGCGQGEKSSLLTLRDACCPARPLRPVCPTYVLQILWAGAVLCGDAHREPSTTATAQLRVHVLLHRTGAVHHFVRASRVQTRLGGVYTVADLPCSFNHYFYRRRFCGSVALSCVSVAGTVTFVLHRAAVLQQRLPLLSASTSVQCRLCIQCRLRLYVVMAAGEAGVHVPYS